MLPDENPNVTALQRQFAGHTHTDIVSTPVNMRIGEKTSIWVGAAGEHAQRPLSDTDAAREGVMAGVFLAIAAFGAGAAACALLRSRLNRVRYATWDRELVDLADNGGWTNRSA